MKEIEGSSNWGKACDEEEEEEEREEKPSRADDVLAFCVPFEISCFEFSALYSNTGKATGHFLLPQLCLELCIKPFHKALPSAAFGGHSLAWCSQFI